MAHNIFATISYSRLDDLNNFTSNFSRNSTINTNLGYSLSVNNIAFSFSPSLGILYSKTPVVAITSVGPVFAFGKSFLKGKLSTSLSIGFVAAVQNSIWNNKTVTNNIGVSYRLTKNHALKFSNNIMYSIHLASTSSEYKGNVTYTYTFDYIVKSKSEQQKNF